MAREVTYICGMISFLKDDSDAQSGGFMGKTDLITLAVIAALVGGFLYYNKAIKAHATTHYSRCAELYESKTYDEALTCYEKAADLHYRTDSLDSIAYFYSSNILEMKERESYFIQQMDSTLLVSDTAHAKRWADSLQNVLFAGESAQQRIAALQKWVPENSDSASSR